MSNPTMNNMEGPRGVPERAIHERQLDPDMILLQRAAAASHQRGQIVEAGRVTVALALAFGGIVVTLTEHGRTVWPIVGFLWFLVSAISLRHLAVWTARQGALLQEMFDTALFHLPWRATVAGDPVPAPDVARLARKLKRGSEKDQRIVTGWYDPTGEVHHPYDVFIAQEQNLAWDARLRRRYAYVVLALAVIWTFIGLVAGIAITQATVTDTLLSFFVPSLAAYQIALEIWYGQKRVAAERERLATIVTTELRNARPGPIADTEWHRLHAVARDVQDGVLRTRLDVSRVPERFYKWYRTNDERDFADTAEGHRRRLAGLD
jgi:hypothetical protein